MITCQDCGAQAVEGVGYCPSCGARLPYRQVSGKPERHTVSREKPKNLYNQMALGKLVALIACLGFFVWTGMQADSWKDKLPGWVPFIGQSSSESNDAPTSDLGEEYRESVWTEKLIALLQDANIAGSEALIAEQIQLNPQNERIYEQAGILLAEYGYRSEAAAVWIAGMKETGIRQIPELIRSSITPADIAVSPALSNAVNEFLHIPVDTLSWSELAGIRTLAVSDRNDLIAPVIAQPTDDQDMDVLLVVLSDEDEPWGIAEWIWLYQLENLRWESTHSPGVHTLEALPALQNLRLKHTVSKPEELETIYALPKLRSLVISEGELVDLAGIEKLQTLSHLEMYRSNATTLAPLHKLPNLTHLRLNGNNRLASADSFDGLTALRELVIEGGELLQMQPLRNLPQLAALTLRNTALKDISFVEQLPLLRSLTLEQNTELSNWQPLGHLSALEQLHLKTSPVDTLPELGELTQLQRLSLEGVRDLQPLASLANLQELTLAGTSARADLRPVAQLSQLASLSLSEGTVMEDSIVQLFSLPALKHLQLAHMTIYVDMNGLAQMNQLEELRISQSSLPLNLASLSALNQLEVLALNQTSFIRNVSIQRDGPVSRIYYDDADWHEQVAQWRPPGSLLRLELAGNSLHDVAFLVDLPHLRELILSDNSLTSLLPLSQLPQLQHLDVRGNPILDDDIQASFPDTTILLSP